MRDYYSLNDPPCWGFLTSPYLNTEIVIFPCTMPPDSNHTKLESSDQESSQSAGKDTGITLKPTWVEKCSLQQFPEVVGIFLMPLDVICYSSRWVLKWRL